MPLKLKNGDPGDWKKHFDEIFCPNVNCMWQIKRKGQIFMFPVSIRTYLLSSELQNAYRCTDNMYGYLGGGDICSEINVVENL